MQAQLTTYQPGPWTNCGSFLNLCCPLHESRDPRLSCSRLCAQCPAQVLDHRSHLMNICWGAGWEVAGDPPRDPWKMLCR